MHECVWLNIPLSSALINGCIVYTVQYTVIFFILELSQGFILDFLQLQHFLCAYCSKQDFIPLRQRLLPLFP